MYATGAVLLAFFSLTTFLIAIPTGVKFVNWIGTMWKGQITFETPMMFACGFLVTFLFGGLTGVLLASPPIDFNVSDTYFVVAHFHYVLFGTIVFATYAGIYFWFPKMTGRMMDETLGKVHFWLTFIGFHTTFLVQHWLGNEGMPRRYADYLPSDGFTTLNVISSIGAFILGASTLPFIWNVFRSYRYGRVVTVDDPWGFGNSLEWATVLPAPAAQLHRAAPHPLRTARVRPALPPPDGEAPRGGPPAGSTPQDTAGLTRRGLSTNLYGSGRASGHRRCPAERPRRFVHGLPARLGEGAHDRHQRAPPRRRHPLENGGDGGAALVHHVLDEILPLRGQRQNEVAAVGRVVAAIQQPCRDQPVHGPRRVGWMHTQSVRDRPEVGRGPAGHHHQNPQLRQRDDVLHRGHRPRADRHQHARRAHHRFDVVVHATSTVAHRHPLRSI